MGIEVWGRSDASTDNLSSVILSVVIEWNHLVWRWESNSSRRRRSFLCSEGKEGVGGEGNHGGSKMEKGGNWKGEKNNKKKKGVEKRWRELLGGNAKHVIHMVGERNIEFQRVMMIEFDRFR